MNNQLPDLTITAQALEEAYAADRSLDFMRNAAVLLRAKQVPACAIVRHSTTALRFATGDLAKAQYVDAKLLDEALARIAERDTLLSEIVEQVGPSVIAKRQYLEQGAGCTNTMEEIKGPEWLDKAGKLLGIDAFQSAAEKPTIQHQGEPAKLRFPTMLRKMWSGGEVQQWLEEQGQLYRLAPVSNGDTAALRRVYDVFGLGYDHHISFLLADIENTKRFSNLLHAVEREFFMVPGEPSDEPGDEDCEPDDECLVNSWGSSPDEYIEQFHAALATLHTRQSMLDRIQIRLGKEQIKAVFLANGFKVKHQEDGHDDLNPYVYDAARALLALYEEAYNACPPNNSSTCAKSQVEPIADSAAYREYADRPATGHADRFEPTVCALEHAFHAGVSHARASAKQ